MKMRFALVSLMCVWMLGYLNAQQIRPQGMSPARQAAGRQDGDLRPDGKGGADHRQGRLRKAPVGQAVTTGNGIDYHGGPVLQGNPVNIYAIYYGNWNGGLNPSDSQQSVNLINTFINTIGNTGYELINSTYGDNTGDVSGNVTLANFTFDNYSQGTDLNSANGTLQNVVSNAISSGFLPLDPGGLYFVFTSSDVTESEGFCTRFCGFHTSGNILGSDIKFSFVGNMDQCPSACEVQATTPNLDSGADAMVNVIAHEMEEAISDPDLNAWFDSFGQENGDKCNFNFGPTQTDANGAQFNQTFGGLNWLIQMNWENARGGGCSQSLGGPFF